MKQSLKKIIEQAKFKPSIVAYFINNNFLIRRHLYRQITSRAPFFKGLMLDFGCGTKPYYNYFSNVDQYVGVDLKIDGWEHRQQTVDVFYDGSTIPFEDKYFDCMLSSEVLEHVFNIEVLLKEFNRVLKINGQALITTPFIWEEHEMPHDFARYTTPALKFLYNKYGFEVVEHHKNGNNFEVICQLSINYFRSLFPKNKVIAQLLAIPFIFYFNTIGVIFGNLLPGDHSTYFNNVFLLKKVKDVA